MTFAEGAAGDRRDRTSVWQHHTLKRLRVVVVFFVCFLFGFFVLVFDEMLSWGSAPRLGGKNKSLLSWGFQFATVHS